MVKLAIAFVLLAQTLTVTIKPATPFVITWDQPPSDDPLSFRLWCDGAIVKNYTAAELTKAAAPNADGSTSYTATAPGLPSGSHSCLVSAFNPIAEAKSDAIPLLVGTAPATPIKLRIVVSVGGSGDGQ